MSLDLARSRLTPGRLGVRPGRPRHSVPHLFMPDPYRKSVPIHCRMVSLANMVLDAAQGYCVYVSYVA